ncbi:LysE family amino acid translocator [Rickettsiales endosymbiont of Paramecium tredecaurelia]|uniref:LysE family translocator n=1 Tax=Candidatus Sarmatiella mevalonica TaxID=2770581 RepID=UPI00192410B4|nr:LysE family transporter [Candidatus Sarmatiella mevalonica]MBL3285175.1 LysE family amino acid translocator [Candidatus Sarmatiella mevalonica]
MSILLAFCKAWMIGIAIAAPVGPIGMLCIKKTLELGIRGALLVGLGAALADSVYGMIASLGLTAVSNTIIAGGSAFKLIGGVFLLYLAYKEAKSSDVSTEARVSARSSVRLVGEVFFLTIVNPMTILSFIGIFASIGVESSGGLESIAMVAGIFIGSMTWSCVLGAIITKVKHKLPKLWLARIKWLSCFILASFGLIAILGFFLD